MEDTVMKRQNGENTCKILYLIKGLVFRLYKEPSKLNSKTTTTFFQNGQKI